MNEILAKARAAAAEMLTQSTGEPRPMWRVIITDSESETGFAPVCTAERSDALHMIHDYPGGPIRDEQGVYDCCPWPQVDTYSTVFAAYVVELLNADAEEEATAAAATATPGFFQAGRRYVSGTWQFRCEAITPSPGTGEIRALGWKRAPVHDVHLWHAAALDPDDWAHGGWADITKDGSQ